IPRVYWTYTRARVLTLEQLEGVQLADLDPAAYALEERRRLAYLMTETWMTMIFRHGFFHGDPHPANILVARPDHIGLVDFGQVGKLTDDDMAKLTRLFIEVAKPYAQSLLRERFGPAYITRQTRREAVKLAQVVGELPHQIHDTLEQMRDGQIEVGFVHKGLDDLMAKLDVLFNRLVVALVVTGGLIGSSLIGIFAKHGPQLFGVNSLPVIGFLLSGLLGLWLMWGVIRSGR